MEENFDSIHHSVWHKAHVETVMNLFIISELAERAVRHDDSKLVAPEKQGYDKFIPLLKTAKYGSPEYEKIREDMKAECLDHHYKENRHHPEHFENGMKGMTIIDLVELICDWFAASLNSDTSFEKGLNGNFVRFQIQEPLQSIIRNTYEEILKPYETAVKTQDFAQLKDLLCDFNTKANYALMNDLITNKQRDEIVSQLNIIRSENINGRPFD